MAAPLTDGQLVVAGRYCGPDEPGVSLLRLDAATGALTPLGEAAGLENPSWVLVHPTEPWLFAVEELGDEHGGGAVVALRFDRTSGHVQVVNRQDSGGGAPCHLAFDRSGRWLAVANYLSGTVAILPVMADGSVGPLTDRHVHEGSSVHPERQDAPHAHSSLFTPDGRYLLTTDLGTDEIFIYAFDDARGTLAVHGVARAHPGAGPRHMAFAPGGDLLCVANELDSTVSVYVYDGDTGALDERRHTSTLPGSGREGNLPSEIAWAGGQQRFLVANRGDDSIAVLALEGGDLRLLGTAPAGGVWPRHFAVDPSGRWLLVAHQESGWISVLELDGAEPSVGSEAGRLPLGGASSIQFVGASTS